VSLFTDEATVAAEIRSDRLFSVSQLYSPGNTLSDSYIFGKVLAAEADAARELRVFLEPTEVLPEGTEQSVMDALDAEDPPKPWVEEPAYDFSPEMFQGEKWGYIVTRQHPIITVTSVIFAYPIATNTVFSVPSNWIRVDKKYGHIRLVPTGTPFYAPLNAYIMSAVGGGRTIPHMLRVRYTAGLSDVSTKWPDLLDLIKKMAVLRILGDQFVPQSGSISADVLKYKEHVDKQLEALRQAIHGQRMIVL